MIRVPTRSMALYAAIVRPVAIAKSTAGSRPDPPRRSACHGRWSQRNPTSRSDDADRAGHAEPLTEDDDPMKTARAAPSPGQRVDDREVAAPVRGRQQDEVGGLDDARDEPEDDALDREGAAGR